MTIDKKTVDKYDDISYNNNMKVTALLSDKLIKDVKQYANGKNLTESLSIALQEWISIKKIKEVNKKIANNPIKFKKDFSAKKIRKINRKKI